MNQREMPVREKQELDAERETTQAGRVYAPDTDILETTDALTVTMEMPGVDRNHIDVRLEKNVLTVTGNVDFSKYEGMEPVYTEYNVGHYTRVFTVSSQIDQDAITATINDGVLEVKLPKHKEYEARQIQIQ
ncbi:MAG: Hsp20/alpha crystallin family protein [Gammaproteobacteria bacterium]|nr:Hsp20/alpha crystallin family protein [Gammaproteobacteria bacterium]